MISNPIYVDEIINQVRMHNEEGLRDLFALYRPLMGKIVSKFEIHGMDYRLDREDLLQEAHIALYKAALQYDGSRGAQFSTFAYTVIYRAVLKTVERYNRVYSLEYKSLDAGNFTESWEGYKSPHYYEDPKMAYEIKELEERIENFINHLNNEEKTVLNMRQNNKTYTEIGKQLGVNTKHVDYVVQKIKKRAQTEINNDI